MPHSLSPNPKPESIPMEPESTIPVPAATRPELEKSQTESWNLAWTEIQKMLLFNGEEGPF